MTDLIAADEEWHDWIVAACAAVGVDDAAVDVTAIHALTRDIAHGFARPMAPVGSYILGLAVGAAAARGAEPPIPALTTALRASFPALAGTGPR